jgi:hypothetical protein
MRMKHWCMHTLRPALYSPDILERISVFVIWSVQHYATWLLLFSFSSVLFIVTCVAGGLISNFLHHTESLPFSVLTDISFIFSTKNTTW